MSPQSGREAACVIQSRLKEACLSNHLVITNRWNTYIRHLGMRIVGVCAAAPGWRHDIAPIELSTLVDLSGNAALIRICCYASDEDPETWAFRVPSVVDASCYVDEITNVMSDIVREREIVISRVAKHRDDTFSDLNWRWETAD